MADTSASPAAAAAPQTPKRPVVCIVIGMAGSGKTTLMQRLSYDLHEAGRPFYTLNLDPAVSQTPYDPNLDIRDTVNYKEVMKQYELGPNGGILTSLNLFATKFDEVMALLERRSADERPPEHVLVDTPGQIEIFTWSASGAIISEALASAFPTAILYVVDTPRTRRPTTFMANMLHACSILYKFRLPLILVFNKVDEVEHDFAAEWMHDFDAFSAALDQDREYMGSLSRSMALMLEEFYAHLRHVGVSAVRGDGVPELLKAIDASATEYAEGYARDLAHRRHKRMVEREAAARESNDRLARDRAADKAGAAAEGEGEAAGDGEGEGVGEGRGSSEQARYPAQTGGRELGGGAGPAEAGERGLGGCAGLDATRRVPQIRSVAEAAAHGGDVGEDDDEEDSGADGPVHPDPPGVPGTTAGGDSEDADEAAELDSFRAFLRQKAAEREATSG